MLAPWALTPRPAVRLLVAFALSLAVGCDPPSTTCGPDNCRGCCDEEHVCHPGVSAATCGADGEMCGSCGAGEGCMAGSSRAASDAGAAVDGGSHAPDAGAMDAGDRADGGSALDGGLNGGAGDVDIEPGDCTTPAPIMFVDGNFRTGGFLVGASSTDEECTSTDALGPDHVFSFDLTSPTYTWAVQRGNGATDPVLKLYADGCETGTLLACTGRNSFPAYATRALVPGTYVVVADSSSGSSGEYELVVSRSETTGDDCENLRELVMRGDYVATAGSTIDMGRSGLTSSCIGERTDQLFRFVPPRTGELTLTMSLSGVYDLSVALYEGGCETATEVACGPLGRVSTLTSEVTAGTEYIVRVGSYAYGNSHFLLEAELR